MHPSAPSQSEIEKLMGNWKEVFCPLEKPLFCFTAVSSFFSVAELYFAHAVVMEHVLFVAITWECFCLLAGCKVFIMDKSS